MNIVVKILVSIVLFFIGFICMGLWRYITVLPSIGLFIASIIAIIAIWKKRPIEGEGDVFKNKDNLNKD
jgi:hypothetical protein